MTAAQSALVRRNATLHDMVTLLREQHAAKLDLVVPATALRSTGGVWEVAGTGEPVLGPNGVTTDTGRFLPTGTCDAGIADKLGIPTAYVRRLREHHLPLYDANVNGWLDRDPTRQFLLRLLRGGGGGDAAGEGVARAVLSSRYRFERSLYGMDDIARLARAAKWRGRIIRIQNDQDDKGLQIDGGVNTWVDRVLQPYRA